MVQRTLTQNPVSTSFERWKSRISPLFICCLALLVHQSGFSQHQNSIRQDIQAELIEVADAKLDHLFFRHERISLDTRQILQQVTKSDFNNQINWQLGEHLVVATLFEHDVRSPDYELEIHTDQGVEIIAPGPCTTYRGHTSYGGEIRISITDERISGFFTDKNDDVIYIQPVRDFIPVKENFAVLYREEDVKADPFQQCGSTHHHQLSSDDQISSKPQRGRSASCVSAQVAIAADYSMYQAYGSNKANLESYLLNLKNLQEASYAFYPIRFQVVKTVIITSNGANPWTTSSDANTLLEDFCCWAGVGQSNQLSCTGGNGFSVTHDLGELWTNRNFSGSTVGVAWISTVCDPMFRYSVNQNLSSLDENRVLISHEQGHNFGAQHVSGEYIMGSYVDPDATDFTTSNQQTISSVATGVACLSSCSGGNPNCQPTLTLTNSSANGTHQAGQMITTSGSLSVSSKTIYDAPNVQIISPFTVSKGTVFEIKNIGCN